MATNSTIIGLCSDKIIRAIKIHWDGYLEYTGKVLYTHYQTQNKINDLIKLGDLSIIDKLVKPPNDCIHTFDNPLKNVTIAYHRDRHDPWKTVKPIKFKSTFDIGLEIKKAQNNSMVSIINYYTYIWDGKIWLFLENYKNITFLKDALIKENIIK